MLLLQLLDLAFAKLVRFEALWVERWIPGVRYENPGLRPGAALDTYRVSQKFCNIYFPGCVRIYR